MEFEILLAFAVSAGLVVSIGLVIVARFYFGGIDRDQSSSIETDESYHRKYGINPDYVGRITKDHFCLRNDSEQYNQYNTARIIFTQQFNEREEREFSGFRNRFCAYQIPLFTLTDPLIPFIGFNKNLTEDQKENLVIDDKLNINDNYLSQQVSQFNELKESEQYKRLEAVGECYKSRQIEGFVLEKSYGLSLLGHKHLPLIDDLNRYAGGGRVRGPASGSNLLFRAVLNTEDIAFLQSDTIKNIFEEQSFSPEIKESLVYQAKKALAAEMIWVKIVLFINQSEAGSKSLTKPIVLDKQDHINIAQYVFRRKTFTAKALCEGISDHANKVLGSALNKYKQYGRPDDFLSSEAAVESYSPNLEKDQRTTATAASAIQKQFRRKLNETPDDSSMGPGPR